MEKFENLNQLEALADGLDEAELRPVAVGDSSDPVQPYVAIWNTSRDTLEGIVKRSNSNLIQHKDAFAPFIDACKEKGVEVKGVLKNYGGQVIIEAQFENVSIDAGEGDLIALGARLDNNYNQRDYPLFRGDAFGFRERCENGMLLGKVAVAQFSTKHMKVSDLQKRVLEFVEQVNVCGEDIQKVISDADEDLFDHERELQEVLLGVVGSKRKSKKIRTLLEDRPLSRFTLYNAITQFATHEAQNERQRVHLQKVAQRVLATPRDRLRHEPWED